jgi:hypothetical protein
MAAFPAPLIIDDFIMAQGIKGGSGVVTVSLACREVRGYGKSTQGKSYA